VTVDSVVTDIRRIPEPSLGPQATAAWLAARGLLIPAYARWRVTILLDDGAAIPTCELQLAIDSTEWSYRVLHDHMMSWIRVKDVPRVASCDDFDLLPSTPTLRNLSSLVQTIEDRFDARLRRASARVRTNVLGAEDKIRLWVVASL
jgi:hypothetical protein